MQKAEIDHQSKAEQPLPQSVKEANAESGSSIEQSQDSLIQELGINIYNLMDQLAILDKDVINFSVYLMNGVFLSVSHVQEANGNTLSFHLSSSEESTVYNWSKGALTCKHVVRYSWVEYPQDSTKVMTLHNWIIDPGGEQGGKSVLPNRNYQEYDFATAGFPELVDVSSQFNEFVSQLKTATAV